jgi:hydrogenase maturation protease
MKQRTLLLGYGNVDREDDGVAWHIMREVAFHFGTTPPDCVEDCFEAIESTSLDFLYVLQLTPELSETIANYQRICFIDAHTGSIAEDVHWATLDPHYQPSPMTHHMTPQTCLSLADTIFSAKPEAILVSVRGYQFGFSQGLSPQTEALAETAKDRIIAWINLAAG